MNEQTISHFMFILRQPLVDYKTWLMQSKVNVKTSPFGHQHFYWTLN